MSRALDRVVAQEQSPTRPLVVKYFGTWDVWHHDGDHMRLLEEFPTHAEAITYATEQATIQALAARFTIPPESPVARALKDVTP